jgi:hypothetical protein
VTGNAAHKPAAVVPPADTPQPATVDDPALLKARRELEARQHEYDEAVNAATANGAQTSADPEVQRSSPPRGFRGQTDVTIFVGPQTREGFVEVDKGVRDSIKDLKGEFRGKTRFRVVETREDARLVLEVVGRGMTSTDGGGAVGTRVGASTFVTPIGTIGIDTVLRVGAYEKPIVFQNCGGWRHCARLVAKDVETWVEANSSTLER